MTWYKITCKETVDIVSKGTPIKCHLGSFHEWEEALVEASGPASAIKAWLIGKYGDQATYKGTLIVTSFDFPKGFYESSEDELIKVYFDGKLVFTWDNEANSQYPEDLTWERDIGSVFHKAYELGLEHGRKGIE